MEKYTPEEAMIEADNLQAQVSTGEARNYTEAEHKVSESEIKTGALLRTEMAKTLSTPLSPENIDTYTEDAVKALLELIDKAKAEYVRQSGAELTGLELENLAFRHYGLRGINETLDYIIQKEKELKALDTVINSATCLDTVVVPPEGHEAQIAAGNGSFKEKLTLPRTKTILFMLANDFDIDVANPEQLKLTTGILKSNMMRREGYTMIEVPSLKRVILCCDEEGNVTYVFDTAILMEKGLSATDLGSLPKPALDELIAADASVGRRVIYTNRFVSNMNVLLSEMPEPKEWTRQEKVVEPEQQEGQYLYPKAPEDYLSATGMGIKWGSSAKTVFTTVEELGESIGDYSKYRFTSKVALGFSPEQQAMIWKRLNEKGVFTEKAPEGTQSIPGMAKQYGVSYVTIANVVEELNETLGELKNYRFGTVVATGFSHEQQELIRQSLEERGAFVKQAPEGYLSIKGMTEKFGVASGVVELALKRLGDKVGGAREYRFQAKLTKGFSPVQQDIIRQDLENRGLFGEKPPEGFLSANGIAAKFGVSDGAVHRAIIKLGASLGEVKDYKFHSKMATGYSPTQQEAIRQFLAQEGLFAEKAPEGTLSAKGLAKEFGVSEATVNKAVTKLADVLGEVKLYAFENNPARGYAPEQQEIVREYLDKNGVFSEKAPAETLSIFGMAKQLGISNRTVLKAAKALGAALGETKKYIFGYTSTEGYTPEQQEMIRKYLVEKGTIKA